MAVFFNQATLSYSGGVVSSNVTTGEILEVLSASKTAVTAEYTSGSTLTYVINIVNSGSSAFTGLTVTDDLGEYDFSETTLHPLTYVDGSIKYFVNGVLQPTPTVTQAPSLTVSGLTVPSGGVGTLVYSAVANEYAPLGDTGSIVNTATVTGGGISTGLSVSETVNAAVGPELEMIKSVSPLTVAENGQLTYTFTIQNKGNAPASASDNVVLDDTFDPILTDINVSFNGASWSSPANYAYDDTTGVFSTVAGEITVPAATFTQDAATGVWTVTPGIATVTVTGTV